MMVSVMGLFAWIVCYLWHWTAPGGPPMERQERALPFFFLAGGLLSEFAPLADKPDGAIGMTVSAGVLSYLGWGLLVYLLVQSRNEDATEAGGGE